MLYWTGKFEYFSGCNTAGTNGTVSATAGSVTELQDGSSFGNEGSDAMSNCKGDNSNTNWDARGSNTEVSYQIQFRIERR